MTKVLWRDTVIPHAVHCTLPLTKLSNTSDTTLAIFGKVVHFDRLYKHYLGYIVSTSLVHCLVSISSKHLGGDDKWTWFVFTVIFQRYVVSVVFWRYTPNVIWKMLQCVINRRFSMYCSLFDVTFHRSDVTLSLKYA